MNVFNELVPILFGFFLYTGPAIALLMSILTHSFWIGLPIALGWFLLIILLFSGGGRH